MTHPALRAGIRVVALSVVLVLAGCGTPSQETVTSLFQEYAHSTTVEGDQFRGGSSADRLAEFASEGTPDQVMGALLAATPCNSDCGDATRLAGPGGQAFQRKILVKHADNGLELLPVYVARKADGTATLVDRSGHTYPGGLDDFRSNNDLSASDWILAPAQITAIQGEGAIVAVTAHTGQNWQPILVWSGIALVVVAASVTALIVSRRRRRDKDDPAAA